MHSMTGMGRARGKAGSSVFLVEIKSVNHRYCEVHARLPGRLQSLEVPVVNRIRSVIRRGKVDIWIGEEKGSGTGPAGDSQLTLNKKALIGYHRFLNQIRKQLKLAEPVTLAHLQAGASFWMTGGEGAKEVWPVIKKLVEKALADLVRMRNREGEHLVKSITSRLKLIEDLAAHVARRKEDIVQESRLKLERRIQKILGDTEVDPGKLANEVAFMADRSDITEELDRLSSHFSQMAGLLKSRGPSGRPMDFLIQEINREWNTIASKTQNAAVAQWVVEAKCEMEKIREQVQNIE